MNLFSVPVIALPHVENPFEHINTQDTSATKNEKENTQVLQLSWNHEIPFLCN